MATDPIFGIKHSNRKPEEFFGKNQFNSAFPVGLANYMHSQGIKVHYIRLKPDLTTEVVDLSIDELFCLNGRTPQDLYFGFETAFDKYRNYATEGAIDSIDLVVSDAKTNTQLRPLEVKLTVIPDNTTSISDMADWGSELVIRAATTEYCVFGMRDKLVNDLPAINKIFVKVCQNIDDWNNETEVSQHANSLVEALNTFERQYYYAQQPLVMQPVWKTKRKSPFLCDDAFDIFVWSDFAFTRLFLDRIDNKKPNKISRPMRCAVRFARAMYESSISAANKINVEQIYRKMSYSQQTDKEFAVSGRVTNTYYSPGVDLTKLSVNKDAVYAIVSEEGFEKLSPERRFDQSVYFTMKR